MTHELLSTEDVGPLELSGLPLEEDVALALVVAWFELEPERVGQVVPIAPGGSWVGRAEARITGDPDGAASLVQQRPGRSVVQPPVEARKLSRLQLRVQPVGDDAVHVRNHGKRRLLHNAEPVTECTVHEGDTLQVEGVVLFIVERRPREFAPLNYYPEPDFEFGGPDAQGMVGESPVAWALRDQLAAVAPGRAHVLIRGESGVGKEIAARTVHALSRRRHGPFLDHNAVALPPGLIDSELFGTARDYPERGMPMREGLIGRAHGGTLLLDEFALLAYEQQAHLLRVMDRDGRYQRLGEAQTRQSNVRILAASNHHLSAFKQDVLARFAVWVTVNGLNDRRSDIPLLIPHFTRLEAEEGSDQVRRFCHGGDPSHPRLDPALVDALLRHHYTKHTRELFALLGEALLSSPGDTLQLTPKVLAALAAADELAVATAATGDGTGSDDALRPELSPSDGPPAPTAEQVEAVVRAANGNKNEAARRLGISRYALYRLLRRSG